MIPLSIPNFEGNEKKYVDDAIEQGWVSTGGAYINEFEHRLAEFLQVEDVAACQSGDRSNLNVYCSSESGKISVRTTYLYGL